MEVPLATFEGATLPVIMSDACGVLHLCNPPARSLLQIADDAEVHVPCWEVARFRRLDGRPFCAARCPVRRRVREGRLETCQRVVIARDGLSRPIDLLTFAIPDNGSDWFILHMMLASRATMETSRDTPLHVDRARERLRNLSLREKQVLSLLAAGHETPIIATRLCISPVTVRNHIQRILKKLRVHRRLEAIFALRHQVS